jgi:hypothetical protein
MKVWPRDDDVKNVLYHPTGGPFREDGTADWPDDTYTHRRILDGDVTTTDPGLAERTTPEKTTPEKSTDRSAEPSVKPEHPAPKSRDREEKK